MTEEITPKKPNEEEGKKKKIELSLSDIMEISRQSAAHIRQTIVAAGGRRRVTKEKITSEDPQSTSKKGEGSETYWSFIRILDDVTFYLEQTLFPMLRRQNVDDKTIAYLAIKMAVGIEDVLISQLALVKPTIESIRSLDEETLDNIKLLLQILDYVLKTPDLRDKIIEIIKAIGKKPTPPQNQGLSPQPPTS